MHRDETNSAASPFRLSWQAVFGGAFAAAGVWLLLHVFGLALGFSRLEPSDPSDLRALGISGGIWTILSSMLAMFAGGVIAARSAGLLGRSNGALHGVVVWAVTTLGGLVLMVTVIASLTRGFAGVAAERAEFQRDARSPSAMPYGPGWANQASATDARPAQDARNGAGIERAREITAGALWALFAMLALSMLSAVAGALVGVTPRQRELSARAVARDLGTWLPPQGLAAGLAGGDGAAAGARAHS